MTIQTFPLIPLISLKFQCQTYLDFVLLLENVKYVHLCFAFGGRQILCWIHKQQTRFFAAFRGSKWTKLYEPLEVMEWYEGVQEDENEVALKMMRKYGWENVRGGQWHQPDLDMPK